MTDVCRQY